MGKFLLSAQLQHQRLRVFPDLTLARRIAVASGSALEFCVFGNECAKPWHLPLVWPVQRRVVDLVQLLRHRALLSRRLRQGARPAEPMLQRGSWPDKKNGGGLQMLRGKFETTGLKAAQHGCHPLILGLAQMRSA